MNVMEGGWHEGGTVGVMEVCVGGVGGEGW